MKAFQLFKQNNPVLKNLDKSIQEAEKRHGTAYERITAAEEALREARRDLSNPFHAVTGSLQEVRKRCEELFIDVDRVRPKNATMYATALLLGDRKLSFDDICEELGAEHSEDISLALTKNLPPLQFSPQNGDVHNLFRYETYYLESGRAEELAEIKLLSSAYKQTKELLSKGQKNERRDGRLQGYTLEKFA